MSTATWGTREAPKSYDPEDIRVGQTLKALLYRTEETPKGYLIRRPIRQPELAANIRTERSPNGVSRQYVTRLCSGDLHMTNEVLMQIAEFLNVDPIAIKRPDPEPLQQRLPIAA